MLLIFDENNIKTVQTILSDIRQDIGCMQDVVTSSGKTVNWNEMDLLKANVAHEEWAPCELCMFEVFLIELHGRPAPYVSTITQTNC